MSYLLYSSDEMFSSTQLIRQSKLIFDKVSSKEIEKAIILRDGKPTFILFDFKEYEAIMKDYMYLKAKLNTNNITKQENIQTTTRTIEQTEDSIVIEDDMDIKEKQSCEIAETKLDDFVVELDDDSIDIANGEIKEFWNK